MMRRRILAILLTGLAGFGIWPNLVGAASVEQVMISEVQISGQSAKDEFIEIYNNGVENFDLSDCQLRKITASASNYLLHRFVAGATIMAQDFYVIASAEWLGEADERYSTSQSLANDNSLQLLCGENEMDLLGWGSVALFEGQALETVSDVALWSYQRTQKVDTDNNFLDFIVSAPSIRQFFSSNENQNNDSENLINENLSGGDDVNIVTSESEETISTLPEQEILSENQSETSTDSNDLEVVADLEITSENPPVLESVAEPSIVEVVGTGEGATEIFNDNVIQENIFPVDSQSILLSEVYPAPNSGENEYLEIYNAGDTKVDLNNWFITDLSEKKFILKDLILDPGEYYLLYYGQSKITLNNDEDQINLYNSAGQWRQGVRYVKAPKGKALFLDGDGQWRWGATSPGFVNPEYVETVPNDVVSETDFNSSLKIDNPVSVVVADPAPVLSVISGEEKKSEQVSSSSAKESSGDTTKKTKTTKTKEYKISNLAAWQTWQSNDLLLLQGKVLLDSNWGVTNRCFLGQGNYVVPVLCTTLKNKFVTGENISLKAKVYFKNNQFEYLKVEEVLPYVDEIELEFKTDNSDLEEYQLWQGQGIIDDLNSSRRLGKVANSYDVWQFRFPKKNDFRVGDQVAWQAFHWKGENYFLLTEFSGKLAEPDLAANADDFLELDSTEASAPVAVDSKLFGAAFGGVGGSCYAVWRWRGVFLKILPKIFG